MPFEIDMLNVGNADAIILRYIDKDGQEYVVLIDAGNSKAHGKKVVDHINTYTDQKFIDLAISTHPDKDHIGGFFYVIENLPILEFWIHDPMLHKKLDENIISEFYDSGDELIKGLRYVVESLNQSKSLITIIDEKGICRKEPLEGLAHDNIPITVLGPSKEYYTKKLHAFRDIGLLYESVALEKAENDGMPFDQWSTAKKKFDKQVDKSNENNSSVILLLTADRKKALFTSDAGPEALDQVIEKYDLANVDFLDVPHHGSKNNLRSNIMDTLNPKTAFISCGQNYPSDFLVAYLQLGGTEVYSTKSSGNLRHHLGMEKRMGWKPAKAL